jgi:hypothetical protein
LYCVPHSRGPLLDFPRSRSLIKCLCHFQMVLERGQGRHSPRPDLGTVASLAIALEQRDGLPTRADLILYILLREIRASERPELVELR